MLTVTELSLEVTTVRESFNCLTLTASVSFTPAFTLVIFKLPALIPVLRTDGPPEIVKPPLLTTVSPIVKEPDGVKFTSLLRSYLTTPSAATEAVVLEPLVKFKPLSNVTFWSLEPFALYVKGICLAALSPSNVTW